MSATIQRRLTALGATGSPTKTCWIVPMRTGESAGDARLRHKRDPELAWRTFVMLPLKRDEVLA